MSPKLRHALAAGLLLAAIPAAQAHPGIGPATGFEGGLNHPFGGWDHLLAMLAVGYWAAQMRSRVVLPAAFLLAMIAGALDGHWIGPVPGLEQGIAASVLVLGLLIARRVRATAAMGATLVGAFALLHGAAHGAEMPATAGAVAYACGFVLATVILLAAGFAAEDLAALLPGRNKAAPGWAFAAAGLVLLLTTSGIRT
jgi:urease accessory protein